MDYTKVFYWLTVADNAKEFFGWFAVFFTVLFVVVTCIRFFSHLDGNVSRMNTDDDDYKFFIEKCNKWTWYSTPFMVVFLSLWIFTPNKKDALLIIAGGQTLNYLSNNDTAKELPNDVLNYVSVELRQMAKEAQVDLGINLSKEKILEKAKTMTADELIKEMKVDSTFAKVILNKK